MCHNHLIREPYHDFFQIGMKVSKDAMSPDEFRDFAERMSQYIDLRGCKTEKCINERIRSKNSAKLSGLIKASFAFRLLLESWLHPHPVYKEILGMDDELYNEYVEQKKRRDKKLKKIKIK